MASGRKGEGDRRKWWPDKIRMRGPIAIGTALVAGIALLPAATAAAPVRRTPSNPPSTTKPVNRTVTLVTGDKVTVNENQRPIRIQPGPGRGRMNFAFRQGRVRGSNKTHSFVIPGDAVGMFGTGKLDDRLFDVTTLLDFGYDDASRADMPVMIADRRGGPALSPPGAQYDARGAAVGVRAAKVRKSAATAFWSGLTTRSGRARTLAGGIQKLWLDGQRRTLLNESIPQIGAPAAWKAGLTGKGVTIAVLDSGVDAKHQDFAGRISVQQNFTGQPSAADGVGHGTHVASIAAGSGAADGGKYRGVAPDAKIANGRVCESEFCSESSMIAGMVWAARTVRARVINISIGGGDTPGIDPLEGAVNELSDQTGALFVISAGNSGPKSIESPGSADAALTVGAVTKKDEQADFSSTGPRVGDSAIKPDISAPGAGIAAARAAGIPPIGEPVGTAYQRLDGTSMAAPHVAGAAAILAQKYPKWTGAQLKAALMASAKEVPNGAVFAQGAGRLDVARAVGQQLTTDPPSVSLPTQTWPHNDDKPVSREITYQNAGAKPVTVALRIDIKGPGGKPAPPSMFGLSAKSLTIAAGKTAKITVTADTRVAGLDGNYSGSIVATTSGTSAPILNTPIAIDREVESYNLTVKYTGTDGAPADAMAALTNYQDGVTRELIDQDEDGSVTLRVPRGRYMFEARFGLETVSGELTQPMVDMSKDTVISADFRRVKPARFAVDKPSARRADAVVSSIFRLDDGTVLGTATAYLDESEIRTASIGSSAPDDRYAAIVSAVFAEPGKEGAFEDSPYAYRLASATKGRMPNGFDKSVRIADLAQVSHREIKPSGMPKIGRACLAGVPGSEFGEGFALLLGSQIGKSQVDYVTPDAVTWQCLRVLGADDSSGPSLQLDQDPTVYRRQAYTQNWSAGVFGPGLGDVMNFIYPGVSQYPDGLSARLRSYSSGGRAQNGTFAGAGLGKVTLSLAGKKLAESGDADVLDYDGEFQAGMYRLDSELTQKYLPLSTRVNSSWTFPLVPTNKPGGVRPPMFAMRFTPKLDVNNAAPAGAGFSIPTWADWSAGASVSPLSTPVLDYSVDDGKTWKQAPVTPNGKEWKATVTNPASGFVSIRVTGKASSGVTARHTIIRAYAIKK